MLKRTIILVARLTSIFWFACDPGYDCEYYMNNGTSDTLRYTLYWRQHDLYKKEGFISPGERKLITEESGVGYASNGFPTWAENLFVNDSIRINVEDPSIYRKDVESQYHGVYTVLITDSLLTK
jgi:hypothetical protein